MFKNFTALALEIEGKLYHFLCSPDSPTTHIKEFCVQLLKLAGQIEDNAAAQAKAVADAQASVPAPPEEENKVVDAPQESPEQQ